MRGPGHFRQSKIVADAIIPDLSPPRFSYYHFVEQLEQLFPPPRYALESCPVVGSAHSSLGLYDHVPFQSISAASSQL